MKLLKLELKNFKGLRSFTLDTKGEDVSIYGDNATGKTSIYDAFLWLLFDKDSQNKKDFDIKTLNDDGEVIHGLDHSVEGTFEVKGKKLTFKKVYAEKWTKKRGSAEKQFTGHSVDHFIDKVPVTKREYDQRISEIIDENVFKLLTNPKFINEQMHWQERRRLLIEVCGDVEDSQVIASNDKLLKLPGILGDYCLEDYRKIIASRRNELNKELLKIPVRIDEVYQGLPDLNSIDKQAHESNITQLSKLIEEKQNKRRETEAGAGAIELQRQLSEIKNQLLEEKIASAEAAENVLAPLRSEKGRLVGVRADLESTVNGLRYDITKTETQIATCSGDMAALRDKWHLADGKSFEFEDKDTCPTCGQSLPAEQVQTARDKAMATFNQEKAESLNNISEKGKQLQAEKAGLEENLKSLKGKLETAEAELQETVTAIEVLTKQIEASAVSQESDPKYSKLNQEKDALELKIKALQSDNSTLLSEIDADIADSKRVLRESESELAKFDQADAGQKRIDELKAQERELAAEYESLEAEQYLTEEFIRSKVRLLEDMINSRFSMAKFKLFNEQVNGGLEEVCETTYQGVPYPSLNNAAKINVGLDIINTLSEHYDFYPTIFIDNKEAVTHLIDVNAQLVALVVSEGDKKLRILTDSKLKKEAV